MVEAELGVPTLIAYSHSGGSWCGRWRGTGMLRTHYKQLQCQYTLCLCLTHSRTPIQCLGP
jgi:hypothetical protein